MFKSPLAHQSLKNAHRIPPFGGIFNCAACIALVQVEGSAPFGVCSAMFIRIGVILLLLLASSACPLPALTATDVDILRNVDASFDVLPFDNDAGLSDVALDVVKSDDAGLTDAASQDVVVADVVVADVANPFPLVFQAPAPRESVEGVPAFLVLPADSFSTDAEVTLAGQRLVVELDSLRDGMAFYWVRLPLLRSEQIVEILVSPGGSVGNVFEDGYSFVHHMGDERERISDQLPTEQRGTSIVSTELGVGTRIQPGEFRLLASNVPVARGVEFFSVLARFTLEARPMSPAVIFSVGVGTDDPALFNNSRIEISTEGDELVFLYRDRPDAAGDRVAELRKDMALGDQRVVTYSDLADEETFISINGDRDNYDAQVDDEEESTADTNARVVVIGTGEDLVSSQFFEGVIDELRVLDGEHSSERLRYESEAMQRDFFTQVERP